MSKLKLILFLSLSVFILLVFSGFSVDAQPVCKGKDIFYSRNCAGDTNSPDETALFTLVNQYRKANGQPELRPSTSLGMVANRRLLDIQQNMKLLTHSWSNCLYEIKDEKTWHCVTDAPKTLNSGYNGQGYETLYSVAIGKATPALALEAWKKSTLHNSIILNQGMFKDMVWNEMGVAVDGQFAVLWFGYPGFGTKPPNVNADGLGVSYDQAVSGLSKMLSIEQKNSSVENNKWQGYSSDKKIKLEIYGTTKELSETTVGVIMQLEPNGKLDENSRAVLSKLLTNMFPEWPDIDGWIERSVKAISLNQNASRTKLVRKIAIEMSSDAANSLKISIATQSKPKVTEVF